MYMYTKICEWAYLNVHHKGTSNQNSAPQNITERPMKVNYLDKWFPITPYVAGVLHPAMF